MQSRREEPEAPEIAGYSDFKFIGQGALSRVYRARQEEYDRTVAVKIIPAHQLDDTVIGQFEDERALTGRLTGHPHIVTALDAGRCTDDSLYLTTTFFENGSLANWVGGPTLMDVWDAVEIGVKMAGALETAHLADVLHRDVKPANIFMSRFDEPALGDFGISMLSINGGGGPSGALTPFHAAPEVLVGDQNTQASDVYSLGSTIYALIAGRAAFRRRRPGGGPKSLEATLRQIAQDPVPPFERDVHPPVTAVLERAMAKQPGCRFLSARELGEALQDAQRAGGQPGTSMICPYPTSAGSSRDPAEHNRLVEVRLNRESDHSERLVLTIEGPLVVEF